VLHTVVTAPSPPPRLADVRLADALVYLLFLPVKYHASSYACCVFAAVQLCKYLDQLATLAPVNVQPEGKRTHCTPLTGHV